jgi:hypothetical protein
VWVSVGRLHAAAKIFDGCSDWDFPAEPVSRQELLGYNGTGGLRRGLRGFKPRLRFGEILLCNRRGVMVWMAMVVVVVVYRPYGEFNVVCVGGICEFNGKNQ